MRFQAASALLLLGLLSLRCNGGTPVDEGMGGSTGGMAGGASTGGTGTGGANDCEEQSCCLAKETYCQGDEIWRRPLDAACDQAAEFREACEHGCAVSTLYEFAYCEDAPQGGAGGLGGAGGDGSGP